MQALEGPSNFAKNVDTQPEPHLPDQLLSVLHLLHRIVTYKNNNKYYPISKQIVGSNDFNNSVSFSNASNNKKVSSMLCYMYEDRLGETWKILYYLPAGSYTFGNCFKCVVSGVGMFIFCICNFRRDRNGSIRKSKMKEEKIGACPSRKKTNKMTGMRYKVGSFWLCFL